MNAQSEIIKIWQEHNARIKQFICHKVYDDDCCKDEKLLYRDLEPLSMEEVEL